MVEFQQGAIIWQTPNQGNALLLPTPQHLKQTRQHDNPILVIIYLAVFVLMCGFLV